MLVDIVEHGQIADTNTACIGFHLTDYHLDERCLAHAVRTDNSDTASIGEVEGKIFKKSLAPERQADFFKVNYTVSEL